MSKVKLFIMIFSIQLATIGCSSTKYLQEREREIGTKGPNRWVFHRLADRDKGTTLAFPGYIITIEKAWRNKIGAPSGRQLRKGRALKRYGFNDSIANWRTLPLPKRFMLNNPKPAFVSGITEFYFEDEIVPHIRARHFYDIYKTHNTIPADSVYDSGYRAIRQFSEHIKEQIDREKITHVFFYVMGWNTDQQEAVRNFNSLFLKLLNQPKAEDDFRPLFIGLTWPSFWNQTPLNVTSFFNKTNDADEIGMMWANIFLNGNLLADRKKQFEVVLLGHSFGAKLVSRAAMSASMLEGPSHPIDLMINLQSAYSINRYSEVSLEPTEDYQDWFRYVDKIALIWSEYDSAATSGLHTPFAGSKRAYKKVISSRTKDNYPGIDTKRFKVNSPIEFDKQKQILLIDGSDVIRFGAYEKGGGAHSDIYNEEVAELIWKLVKSATF